ncbi:hypothetical protein BGZ65_012405 [Modicella reniformis]|uniref:Uncharacterized protein n=1 Tax=Modicella reniformis TaxID=1440133 RepID=A0A9P6SUI4_9FUNG|nr:hypothetical protein BGZ65_012405 [Modicella reniformis]
MTLKYVAVVEKGLYVAYTSLTLLAVVPIYFGSFASLKRWKNPKETRTTVKRQIDGTDESEEDLPSELVSLRDACTLPVLGSVALYGLYLACTQCNKTYVNYVLTAYFGTMGALVTTQAGVSTLTAIIGLLGIKIDDWHINLIRKSQDFYSARFTIVHLFMLAGSILLSGYYVATKDWVASNIFAINFALNAIQVFSLESFKTGLILLSGLSACDVLWSYNPEIMAIVTKNLDVPVKIVFPQLLFGLPAGQAFKFASIGLGDIVIPGLFAALCLRFDQHRAGSKNPELGQSTQFRKPYFTGCIVAYILGLGSMFFINHVTMSTLPALLYLGPACVFSMVLAAAVRGETEEVFKYISEEGRAANRKKNEPMERKRKQQAQAMTSRDTPRVSRLPNVIKEELFVPATSTILVCR